MILTSWNTVKCQRVLLKNSDGRAIPSYASNAIFIGVAEYEFAPLDTPLKDVYLTSNKPKSLRWNTRSGLTDIITSLDVLLSDDYLTPNVGINYSVHS